MRHTSFRMSRPLLGVFVLALVATACAGGASAASGGGTPTMRIIAPKDGATVGDPFTVKVQSSVPLGDPSTGEHHVHLCFDGASCDSEYTLVYGNNFVVRNLTPGRHTIEASLRNADHSDTGVHTSIVVTVSAASAGAGTTGSNAGGTTGSKAPAGTSGSMAGSGSGYGY
jgi:hypothetical protein